MCTQQQTNEMTPAVQLSINIIVWEGEMLVITDYI